MRFVILPPVKGLILLFLAATPAFVGVVSCSNQVKTRQPVSYRYGPECSVHLWNGMAYPPLSAPATVKRAIVAGNRLQRLPYKWGGGHASFNDSGYDCSGTVSYTLREAGIINTCLASNEYFNFGEPGPGKWITIYVQHGHVFMTIAGLRLDTGGSGARSGPRWKPQTRDADGYVMRHPVGL